MKAKQIIAASILLLFCLGLISWAEGPGGAPKYNPENEVTLKGVVQEVKDFHCPVSGGIGAHLVLKAEKGPVTVHLALSKFLSEYGFGFVKGDEVQIIGAKVKVGDDENAILARQVERGNQVFTFRSKDGKPLW